MALGSFNFMNRKSVDDTGFGTNHSMYGGRYLDKKGKPNIRLKGIGLLERMSWYHVMMDMPSWKFISITALIFLLVNLLFATVYYLIGVDSLGGLISQHPLDQFAEAFFFSAQTFTTVGYGRINPIGFWSSAVASFEAFLGIFNFAVLTGLVYGRFSKPKAFLRFADKALFAPYKEGVALMLRFAPYKNNYLTDAEVKLTLALTIKEEERVLNRFYSMDLEMSKVNALSTSWTLVHPIDEKSPLKGLKMQDLEAMSAEVMVFVKAFDEAYSNSVVARGSYTSREMITGGKYLPMYHRSEDGLHTILQMNMLSSYEKVNINHLIEL